MFISLLIYKLVDIKQNFTNQEGGLFFICVISKYIYFMHADGFLNFKSPQREE